MSYFDLAAKEDPTDRPSFGDTLKSAGDALVQSQQVPTPSMALSGATGAAYMRAHQAIAGGKTPHPSDMNALLSASADNPQMGQVYGRLRQASELHGGSTMMGNQLMQNMPWSVQNGAGGVSLSGPMFGGGDSQ